MQEAAWAYQANLSVLENQGEMDKSTLTLIDRMSDYRTKIHRAMLAAKVAQEGSRRLDSLMRCSERVSALASVN